MNLRNIKLLVDLGLVPSPPPPSIVRTLKIQKNDGEIVDASIESGVDFKYLEECNQWSEYVLKMLVKAEELGSRIDIMVEDFHWDWLSKYPRYFGEEFIWYFLKANETIQAVAIIYHPKNSATSAGEIFYVEYISVAPWNRKSNLYSKVYSNIAPTMLQAIQKHIIEKYGYKYGFSLHSLPQAERFYSSIGMMQIPSLAKDGMKYFELEESLARTFVEGALS